MIEIIAALCIKHFFADYIFNPAYQPTNKHIYGSIGSLAHLGTHMVIMFTVVLAGWLSDILGRKLWFILTSLATIILIWPICNTLATGGYIEIFAAELTLAFLVGCYIGPEPALQMEMYPTHVRNTGVAVSYNLGCAIFGGTTPAICKLLYDHFHTIDILAHYILIVAALSIFAVMLYKNRSGYKHQ